MLESGRRFTIVAALKLSSRGQPNFTAWYRPSALQCGWVASWMLVATWAGCDQASPRTSSFQVATSSMAPKMWGPRLIAACTACQRQHYVAADSYKPTLLTRCPTCGGSCRILPGVQPGEIVSIADPTTPADAPPQRLACVAFTLGEEPASAKRTAAQWLVKRVWGLPGERLAFRNGELWIDGVLLQKSLDELEQVAVPVARYDREPSTSRSNNTTSRPEQLGAAHDAAILPRPRSFTDYKQIRLGVQPSSSSRPAASRSGGMDGRLSIDG